MSFLLLIILTLIGLALGNLLTTLLYRLPRNISPGGLFDKRVKPFCGKCRHPLKFYEYLPVFSWITSGRKCNYCGAPIPLIYTITEVAGGLVLPLTYIFKCGNDWDERTAQLAFIYSLYALGITLAIGLFVITKKQYTPVTLALVWLGSIQQTMTTGRIDDLVLRVALMLIAVMLLLKALKRQLDPSVIPYVTSITVIAATWGCNPAITAALACSAVGLVKLDSQQKYHYAANLLLTYIATTWL